MRFSSEIQVIPALIRLILVCAALFASDVSAADRHARAEYLGSFVWRMDKPWFGGWSAIEMSGDGLRMTAMTDRGRLLRADVDRNGDSITAITPRGMWRLKASNGAYLTQRIIDSEGLAILPGGPIHVSFEGVTRVARYSHPAAAAQVLRENNAFRDFPGNKSIEALAIDPLGRLYAIPEVLNPSGQTQVFVLDGDRWAAPFMLTGGQGFLPVGADFGPDGRLYLLERGWSVFGFRARVRRWDMVGGSPGNEQLLLQTRTGTHDNLEGLTIWRDTQGRTRLTMVSDDNFLAVQSTELVEYALTE